MSTVQEEMSPFLRHQMGCDKCLRARGTLQLCDVGANLFRQMQERERWPQSDDEINARR